MDKQLITYTFVGTVRQTIKYRVGTQGHISLLTLTPEEAKAFEVQRTSLREEHKAWIDANDEFPLALHSNEEGFYTLVHKKGV